MKTGLLCTPKSPGWVSWIYLSCRKSTTSALEEAYARARPRGREKAAEEHKMCGRVDAPRIAITIAGFDPSSGAGVTADLKTFSAHGLYGVACITALTVQSTQGVRNGRAASGRLGPADTYLPGRRYGARGHQDRDAWKRWGGPCGCRVPGRDLRSHRLSSEEIGSSSIRSCDPVPGRRSSRIMGFR